jgi:hypothetical protein
MTMSDDWREFRAAYLRKWFGLAVLSAGVILALAAG